MRKYVFIGLGGILGAILRYYIKNIHIYHYEGVLPLNTLIVNLTGSFLLALILTIALKVLEFDSDIRLGIGTGFLGAYTTFSTMCKETVSLINRGCYYSAAAYLIASAVLGLGFAYFGIAAAGKVVAKLAEGKKYKETSEEESAVDIEKGVK